MQDSASGDLAVPPDTVCWIVERAHDLMGKTAPSAPASEDDNVAAAVLEARGVDPVAEELASAIADLTEDAQIDLVALMWLGRDPTSDWAELRAIARHEHTAHTPGYLCGTPLLADHLRAGLDRLGLDCDAWLARTEL
jgi:hypothetical protein